MAQSKEQNKSPETNPVEMKVYELSDKEFKNIHLKDAQQAQENGS